MQVALEAADLDLKTKMCAGSVVMLAIGRMSVDAEEETEEMQAGITDEEAIQGRDAGRLTDTSREEAAEVIQERMNEGRADASVANNEDTSRLTALKEVAVAETPETDMMIDEEIMVEIVEELVVTMAAETWLVIEMVEETAVEMETLVVTFLAVGHP
jgi:hypothetical protein